MKTIEAIIERTTDGTFSVYCVDEMFTGMGNTAEKAKKDMRQQMEYFKKTAMDEGFSYPGFLDEDFEIVFKFETESLLEYYSGILSLSGLEKITGIHQKQLWNYLHRKSKNSQSADRKNRKGIACFGF